MKNKNDILNCPYNDTANTLIWRLVVFWKWDSIQFMGEDIIPQYTALINDLTM